MLPTPADGAYKKGTYTALLILIFIMKVFPK